MHIIKVGLESLESWRGISGEPGASQLQLSAWRFTLLNTTDLAGEVRQKQHSTSPTPDPTTPLHTDTSEQAQELLLIDLILLRQANMV